MSIFCDGCWENFSDGQIAFSYRGFNICSDCLPLIEAELDTYIQNRRSALTPSALDILSGKPVDVKETDLATACCLKKLIWDIIEELSDAHAVLLDSKVGNSIISSLLEPIYQAAARTVAD